MILDPASEQAPPSFWQYVPVSAYQRPAAPVTHSARERVASILRLFRRGKPKKWVPAKEKDKLLALPACLMENIAPFPDWKGAAEALDVVLGDWMGQENPRRPVTVVVGPPHSGNIQTLMKWAETQSWQVLTGPTPEQVLAGDDTWFVDLDNDSQWIFPFLEKAYLRHAEGLTLIRRFLDHACSGKLGRGVIGCDSWAWAFLSHVWRGRTPSTLTLQAFDQSSLAHHFQRMVDGSRSGQLIFCQSDNGHFVLPPPVTEMPSGEESNFLQILAAYSRGNLGVAQAVWRASMQTEPDVSLTEADIGQEFNIPHKTIWIPPWSQVQIPFLPANAGVDEAFVLHSLLLHNGLTLEVLKQLLSLSASRVAETTYRLQEGGLVDQKHSLWQVTPLGYPAVRQFLATSSYLVDHF